MLFTRRVSVRAFLVVLWCGGAFQGASSAFSADHHKSPEEAALRRKAISLVVAKLTEAERVLEEAKKNGTLHPAAESAAAKDYNELQAAREKQTLIEDELLATQPADSEIGKSLTAFVQTKTNLEVQTDRILNSPECKARLKQVEDAVNSGALQTSIRKEALENDRAYQAAQDEFRFAKTHFTELKTNLFSHDTQWNAASQAVRDAIEKLKQSQQAGEGLPQVALQTNVEAQKQNKPQGADGAANASAEENVEMPQDPVLAARITIVQCKRMLRQLGVKNINKFLKDYRGEL